MSLDGEIVEIIEAAGVCSLRLLVHQLQVLDLASRPPGELHLGDRIAIDGVLRVEAVRSLPDPEPVRHAAPGPAGVAE